MIHQIRTIGSRLKHRDAVVRNQNLKVLKEQILALRKESEQRRNELQAVLELRLKEWDAFKAELLERENDFLDSVTVDKEPNKHLPWLRRLICWVLAGVVTYYLLK